MSVIEGRDSFLRTIAQITSERAASRPVVETLRASASDVWESDVPQAWRTAGFVQELTAAASAMLESNPRESLALAQLALAIATSIPAGTYAMPVQAQLEGSAWKEIGTAHRYLSEHDASLRAYDAAQRAFGTANALALDSAVIDFARAIVLVDLEKYDEALLLLAAVEPQFESFDDRRHFIQAQLLRGNIFHRLGQLENAKGTYAKALRRAPADDLHTTAMLQLNLGQLLADVGEKDKAVTLLHQARQLLTDLNMPTEVARTDWNIGRLVQSQGDFTNAESILRAVRSVFLTKGMTEEAGLAGLDLADGLIALARIDEARQIIEDVLAEFTRANLNLRAVSALAYLRDVLPTAQSPHRTVQHVRTYLEKLRSVPACLFAPLPED